MSAIFSDMYVFTPEKRGIFAEIYFPKKARYQGKIFDALEEGLDESVVKWYLNENLEFLLPEFHDYPHLFDPCQYGGAERVTRIISTEEARERISMYHSPFYGWSMYEVNGAFLSASGRVDEELTQVIRLMFRFESSLESEARHLGCLDVLNSILLWITGKFGRLDEHSPWGRAEMCRFMEYHKPWPKGKRQFAEKHFAEAAKEIAKWIDDCALFVFGYLVRKFWKQVVKRRSREDEIWVTSFLNLDINAVKPEKSVPPLDFESI